MTVPTEGVATTAVGPGAEAAASAPTTAKGPSKSELKKAAKKAEKAANKTTTQQSASGGGAGAPTTNSTITNDAAAAAKAQPGLQLVNANVDSVATYKVIWAGLCYGVDMTPASTTTHDTAVKDVWGSDKPALVLQTATAAESSSVVSVVSGGGGNAMVQTIAYMTTATSKKLTLHELALTDEWCEWERTVLRPAATASTTTNSSIATLETALQVLTNALLQTKTQFHLLPTTAHDTVSDICILSTLFFMLQQPGHENTALHLQQHHPIIYQYLQAHDAIWKQVTQKVKEHAHSNKKNKSAGVVTIAPSQAAIDAVDWNEPSITNVLEAVFAAALVDLFGADTVQDIVQEHIISKCSNPKLAADFQCNAAMKVFAALKKGSASLPLGIATSLDVAKAICTALDEVHHPVVEKMSVQGPGFVVFNIKASFLEHHMRTFQSTKRLPVPVRVRETAAQQVCVVDFSSPNIAKEMHVGHLRSTIIGESVCRILEFCGYKTVHRINHVGDWGTQFGMLIQYLKEEYPDVAAATAHDEASSLPNITDLTEFYKNAKARFDASADFKRNAQLNVVQLQSGNPECLRIWKLLCDISRLEFQKVYQRLDVTVTECGESFYNAKIPAVVQEFEAAGKIKLEEGGAKCVFCPGFNVPLMLQKSDGGYGYDSTDMAALKYRLQELKADRIIVITDFSQGDHFKMVYWAGKDIGWLDRNQKLEHIGFGTVMGEDGKRFKTRSGDTVRLVDLLDEAVHRMETQLKERIAENRANITLDQVTTVAEAVGYGAVKYYDLRRNPTTNYKFSYDQMLDTKGDTAVYLLYARVRLESICTKAKEQHGVDVDALWNNTAADDGKENTIVLSHNSERLLALQLLAFADAIAATMEDLYPYHICDYVYQLSNAASDFVTQCKVLGSPEMNSRLLLCRATVLAMNQCFDLIGIRHVQRI